MKIVAKSLIYDEDGNILVLRRSNTHPIFPYHLDFPGGAVEIDEEPINAAKREIFEETGLIIPENELNLIFSEHITDETDYLIYSAKIKRDDSKIVISWEHDQFDWINQNELISKPAPKVFDRYFLTVIKYLSTL